LNVDRKITKMKQISDLLGIEPDRITHFAEAMTHSSCEERQNNRKLAFLGDAVLELAVTQYILSNDVNVTVGEMTKRRASVVNCHFLYSKAIEWQLNRSIRLGKGERQTGGEMKETILAESVEALIGAIFLDCGYEKTRAFVERNVIPERIETKYWNFKGKLQELTIAEGLGLPEYFCRDEEGLEKGIFFISEVLINGRILGKGHGRNRKTAEQLAAKDAIEEIRKGKKEKR